MESVLESSSYLIISPNSINRLVTYRTITWAIERPEEREEYKRGTQLDSIGLLAFIVYTYEYERGIDVNNSYKVKWSDLERLITCRYIYLYNTFAVI